MSELKPCPFCGEMPELSTRPCYYYQCVKSGCEGQEVSWNNTEEEALKSWNTRPIEDALCAEVAKLMKENEALKSKAIVWHEYPDDKPDIVGYYIIHYSILNRVAFDFWKADIQTWDKYEEYITHWAYLPEPPKEEK